MLNFMIAAALAAIAPAQATAPASPVEHSDHKGMQHEGHDMACCKDKAADCCKDKAADCCKDKAKADCCKHEMQGSDAPADAKGHQHQH